MIRLYPSGTPLRDVPPDFHGMNVREWLDMECAQMAGEAPKRETSSFAEQKISTSRDNYGWRSIPSGTRYLGQ